MRPGPVEGLTDGLAGLRNRKALSELLFLYECATLEPARLRTIAERLGLTVQAASHTYRELKRRGLATVRDGRYRPTVQGVARLHGTLDRVAGDVRDRSARLHMIRSTRAVAEGSGLVAGDLVALELREGILTARRSRRGSSRGTVVRGGPPGSLVEITGLTGIVPLRPSEIAVRTLSEADLDDPDIRRRLRDEVPRPPAVLAAEGPEVFHLLRASTDRPILRFAPALACLEASRLGIESRLFVLERDVPRVLGALNGPVPPPLRVDRLRSRSRKGRG